MKKLSKTILIGLMSFILAVPHVIASAAFAENKVLVIAGKASCGSKGNKNIGDYSPLQKSDENQIDIHAFKIDCVGSSGSLFNIYVNKSKSSVILVKISDTSIISDTSMSLQEVKDVYPVSGKK